MSEIYLFLYVTVHAVRVFLSVLQFAFLLRVLMSFLRFGEEDRFTDFLFGITEPVIYPIRALCARFGWFEDLPIDIPFVIAYFILSLVGILLPSINL